MTNATRSASLRRDRIIAWITVILSIIAIVASRPTNLTVILLLFFALLGSLVWILIVGFNLRRTKVPPTHREAAFWRVAFLWIFAGLNVYLCFYQGLANWKSWWGCVLIAMLCIPSALLMWRGSAWARYPLYALTLFLGLGALGSGIYGYVTNPMLLHESIKAQITGWLIPGLPTALLINCCWYARRMASDGLCV